MAIDDNISDNQTPKRGGFNSSSSSSSSILANAANNNNDNFSTTAASIAQQSDSGMPGWALLLIIAGCILLLVSLGIGGYLLTKRLRDRRKNHGEYRPQQVEHLHAKDLPYITPPNIEGLM